MSAEQKVLNNRSMVRASMVIGHTGDKIFDSITSNAVAKRDGSASETNLFAMLDSAIAALKTPVADSEADKETAAAALDKTNGGLKLAEQCADCSRGIRHAAERTGVAGFIR